jgi:hypothetical protein|tara:strand:+ start:351 stop:548 length:198 start_codon:yes stop_codon:yes gene_type:complete
MIRVGDSVCLIFNMGKVGKVTALKEAAPKTWMVGGAMTKLQVATVLFEDGETIELGVSDLMRLDS